MTYSNLCMSNDKAEKYYALDIDWYVLWKNYIDGNISEKYTKNVYKRISPNKNIGVLPPGEISNKNLFADHDIDTNTYKLKEDLLINRDYMIVSEFVWNFFLLNYGGGPEIELDKGEINIYNFSPKKSRRAELKSMKNSLLENNNDMEKDRSNRVSPEKEKLSLRLGKMNLMQSYSSLGDTLKSCDGIINTMSNYNFENRIKLGDNNSESKRRRNLEKIIENPSSYRKEGNVKMKISSQTEKKNSNANISKNLKIFFDEEEIEQYLRD